MESWELQQLMLSLPHEKEGVVFPYFKDRYALALLSYFVGNGRSMRDVKSSRFAGLLDKPAVKGIARGIPNGRITADALLGARADDPSVFVLTFGTYGYGDDERACQTSRPGFNLVIQVNFPDAHDRAMVRMLAPGNDEFSLAPHGDHPISFTRRTMSWVRVDYDFCSGEALIEEVQNDWIRTAAYRRHLAQRALGSDEDANRFRQYIHGAACAPRDYIYYADRVLRPFEKMWSEATLAAAIWVLAELLGIKRIFYHTHVSGAVLKEADEAPVSLYSDLPRRFCFREVRESPIFLEPALATAVEETVAVAEAGGRGDGKGERAAIAERPASPVPFYLLDLN